MTRPRVKLPDWVSWCGWFARHTFLVLIGLNLALTFRREVEVGGKPLGTFLRRRLERGALIYCAGVVIQLTTFCFQGAENEIRFGVLHSIGVLVGLASLLLYLLPSRWAFVPASAVIGAACQWTWYNRWNWWVFLLLALLVSPWSSCYRRGEEADSAAHGSPKPNQTKPNTNGHRRYMWWAPMKWCHEHSPFFLSQILYAFGSPDTTDKGRRAPDYFPLIKWIPIVLGS